MNRAIVTFCVIFGAAVSNPALAEIVVTDRETAGGLTYNRPIENLSSLSAVGTAVRYDEVSFTVDVSSEYTFLSTATFDNFITLYGGAFNAGTPLTNAVVANDDLVSFTTAGFAETLTAGVTYTAVVTGFGNGDFGDYSLTIGGAGEISNIPSTSDSANISTFSGSTSGEPVFNRPLEDFSGLSAVGTAVAYDVLNFTMDTGGEYSFLETALFDSFLFLYLGGFDPDDPLTNGLVGSDDLVSFTTSGFVFALDAGVNYSLVLTSFGNTDFGDYSLTIGGPGRVITPTVDAPEPSTWALMMLGFGGVVIGARNRRAYQSLRRA